MPNPGGTSWTGYVVDGSGTFHSIGTHAPADITVWHHYALSYDVTTDTGRMYFDGVQVATATAGSTNRAANTTVTVELGHDDAGASRFGNGWLDEVALYPTALTTEQISNHFAAAPAFVNTPYSLAVLADSPVALWRMDETAGPTLIDSAPLAGVPAGHLLRRSDVRPNRRGAGRQPVGAVRSRRRAANDYATAPNVPMTKSFSVEFWAKSATSPWNTSGWFAADRAANGFIMHPNETHDQLVGLRDRRGRRLPRHRHPRSRCGDHRLAPLRADLRRDDGRRRDVLRRDAGRDNASTSATNRAANTTVTVEIGRDDTGGPLRQRLAG